MCKCGMFSNVNEDTMFETITSQLHEGRKQIDAVLVFTYDEEAETWTMTINNVDEGWADSEILNIKYCPVCGDYIN